MNNIRAALAAMVAFFGGLTIQRSLFWGCIGSFAVVVLANLVAGLFAASFGTTLAVGWAIMMIFVPVSLLFGLGLTVEFWIRLRGGAAAPSFLERANKFTIGTTLSWSAAAVIAQVGWSIGAHFGAPQFLWYGLVVLEAVLMMVSAGMATRAVGGNFGKEFLPSVLVALLAGYLLVGAIYLFGQFFGPAQSGGLYYVWGSDSCQQEKPAVMVPRPVTAYELRVTHGGFGWSPAGLIGLQTHYWSTMSKCEVYPVEWSEPTHREWADDWSKTIPAQRQAQAVKGLVTAAFGTPAVFVVVLLGILGIRSLKGAATLKGGQIGWLFVAFAFGSSSLVCCCGGMWDLDNFLGGDPVVKAEQAWAMIDKDAKAPIVDMIQFMPGETKVMGRSNAVLGVRLCNCGAGQVDVHLVRGFNVNPDQNKRLMSARARACGSQVEYLTTTDNYYARWSGTEASPPMAFVPIGETVSCPDGYLLTSPAPTSVR